MNPKDILAEYYDRRSKTFEILISHGEQVARKATKAAKPIAHLKPDLDFIVKASMLHDIGILETNSPGLACSGSHPYICHGILGRELLEKVELPEYGLICERHVGVGITADDIRQFNLPLPARDMLPISIEEQLICYADKFFSKNGHNGKKAEEKSVGQILSGLERYGSDKVKRFQSWMERFEP
jgi:uncharacterized protein